jgi:hypothetical protein
MGKSFTDDSIPIEEKLTRFDECISDIQEIITMIQMDPLGQEKITNLMRDRLDLNKIKRIARHLNQFLEFPKEDRRVKYPDSEKEKKKFSNYREKGLSIRAISEKTGIPKDTVQRKLKRYEMSDQLNKERHLKP